MASLTDGVMRLQFPTDRLILQELQRGRNVPANIADEIGKHQKTVAPRVLQLADYGLIKNLGRGVYELTERGEIALEFIDEYDHGTDKLEERIEAELARRED